MPKAPILSHQQAKQQPVKYWLWLPLVVFPLALGLSTAKVLAKSPSPGVSPSPHTSPPAIAPAMSPSPHTSPKPTTGASPTPLPVGGVKPAKDSCPSSHPIKGNVGSHGKIFHSPGTAGYKQTKPEVCFATTTAAETAGFKPPKKP